VLDPSAAFTPQMTMAYPGDSVARQVQARSPRARVVKTLNTMNFTIMVDPFASLDNATVFLSGDDSPAKAVVAGLLGDLGWPSHSILDPGGVDTALATEHVAPLFFATVMGLQTAKFNIGLPVTPTRVRPPATGPTPPLRGPAPRRAAGPARGLPGSATRPGHQPARLPPPGDPS